MKTEPGRSGAGALLLVLPLPVYLHGGIYHLDGQAQNGLRRWLDNFDSVTFAVPTNHAPPPADAPPLDLAQFGDRFRLVALPNRRSAAGFARALPRMTKLLGDLIDKADYLHFAIGGLWGDWAAVAALIAHRRGRPAAVWTDRVESAVRRVQARRSTGPKRAYHLLSAWAMERLERTVVRRTRLGLFHGADCYAAYARFSPEPHLVHDIHLSADAQISPEALAAKIAHAGPLRIVYAGRAHPDKGPLDWVATLARLDALGHDFDATWFGQGPQLDEAREAIARAELEAKARFPGPLLDRDALLARIREADLFLFCHKTLESPRCLLEALISGTPIVGYDSAYPRDLIANGGGSLTSGEPHALAAALAGLDADRAALARLQEAAAAAGEGYTDAAVFQHRSDLMKQHLAQ